jgi:uncharacterized protein YqeY
LEDGMALKEQISADLKSAMKDGDLVRRETLRSLLTAVNNAEVARVNVKDESASRQELGDSDILDVFQKQAKQRRESIVEYEKAGRSDLAERERAELEIIEGYLPKQMSREEIVAEVTAIIAATGASGPSDKSKVMPPIMRKLKGQADGRLINEVVTELLAARG